MEEVRRVQTTTKRKKSTTILLILAGILGIGLIAAAIYFYAIGDITRQDRARETTCACYYIDPAVVSGCGDPRRGFLFKLNTVPGDEVCRASCSTSDLSPNLLNSNTEPDLYEVCQLQSINDTRCLEMVVKDQDGKIVTGKVKQTDTLTIEATFDAEYADHKFVVNNEDYEPETVSSNRLNIERTITNLNQPTYTIFATATDTNGEEINSPLCRRLIEVEQGGESNVNDIQLQTRREQEIYKISRIRIGVGNIPQENLSLRFSFDNNLADLTMTDGFVVDIQRGEIVIVEQDLYEAQNFSSSLTFSQFDDKTGDFDITVEVRVSDSTVGTASTSFTLREVDLQETPEGAIEASNFFVSKTSDLQCVQRTAPNNTARFTILIKNNSSVIQKVNSVKDKLPLGFSYIQNSTRLNGTSTIDTNLVTITTVGDTQEILWETTGGWSVNPGGTLEIEMRSLVGSNALTGSNQNEVIITPEEIPEDPTTLRAESLIQVAQNCEDPQEQDEETTTPTPPPTSEVDEPTTPETGLFDSFISKVVLSIIVIMIGWIIYSKPLGRIAVEKLVDSNLYKEAEFNSWRLFKPRKYFETKVVKSISKKKR